jgi:hypothetical protein
VIELRIYSASPWHDLGLLPLRIVVVLLLLAGVASAFDRNRMGFVAGFGLGYSPHANWTRSNDDVDMTESGLSVDIVLGHGWNEQNAITWGITGTTFDLNEAGIGSVVQGLNGIHWFHFFRPVAPSVYTSLGLGIMVFTTENTDDGGRGPGFQFEFGYELLSHVQVSGYVIYGWTNSNDLTSRHRQLGLLVRAVGY